MGRRESRRSLSIIYYLKINTYPKTRQGCCLHKDAFHRKAADVRGLDHKDSSLASLLGGVEPFGVHGLRALAKRLFIS